MCNIHIIDADSFGSDDLNKFANSKLAKNEKVFVCANNRLNSISELESKHPSLFYFLHAPTMKNGADVYILLELREFIGRVKVSNMHLYSAPDKEQIANMKVAAHYFGANFHWQQSNLSKKESYTLDIEMEFKCKVLPTSTKLEIDSDDLFMIPSKLDSNKKRSYFSVPDNKPSKAGRSVLKLLSKNKPLKFNHLVQGYYRENPNKLNEFINYKNSAKSILSNLIQQGWIIRLRKNELQVSLPMEPNGTKHIENQQPTSAIYKLTENDKALTSKEAAVTRIMMDNNNSMHFDELLNQYMTVNSTSFVKEDSYKLSLSAIVGNLVKKGALEKLKNQSERNIH